MSKVYVLKGGDYESFSIYGIYTTPDLAIENLERYVEDQNTTNASKYGEKFDWVLYSQRGSTHGLPHYQTAGGNYVEIDIVELDMTYALALF